MISTQFRRLNKTAASRSDKNPGGIEVKGLEVFYGDNPVIKGIDLVFPPGKVTAIIGPSGCGKTTLLRCLNRLSELSQGCSVKGKILVDGRNIYEMDPMLLRRRVGMVFQKPNPFPKSIKENILYGIKATKMEVNHEDVVKSSLEMAALWSELKGRLNDSAFSLSLGQQQRLCFARSLAVSPEVILLDEPASSLDPVSTMMLESSIIKMKDRFTQIIVTHNMNEALKVSDYVAFLHQGNVVEFGETRCIFESPKREETREYIAGRFS